MLLFILTVLVIHLMMQDDAILVAGDAILRFISGHTSCLAKQRHLFTALSIILFTVLVTVLLIHCSLFINSTPISSPRLPGHACYRQNRSYM